MNIIVRKIKGTAQLRFVAKTRVLPETLRSVDLPPLAENGRTVPERGMPPPSGFVIYGNTIELFFSGAKRVH